MRRNFTCRVVASSDIEDRCFERYGHNFCDDEVAEVQSTQSIAGAERWLAFTASIFSHRGDEFLAAVDTRRQGDSF